MFDHTAATCSIKPRKWTRYGTHARVYVCNVRRHSLLAYRQLYRHTCLHTLPFAYAYMCMHSYSQYAQHSRYTQTLVPESYAGLSPAAPRLYGPGATYDIPIEYEHANDNLEVTINLYQNRWVGVSVHHMLVICDGVACLL